MRERHTTNVNETNDFRVFDRNRLLRYALAAATTGLAAAIIGPFGTYETMQAGPRYAFWLLTVATGWAQMLFIAYALRGFIDHGPLAGWPAMLIASALGAFPILFVVRFFSVYLTDGQIQLAALWFAYLQVFVITFLFSLVQWLLVEKWPLFPGQGPTSPDIQPEPRHAAEPDPNSVYVEGREGDASIRLRRMPDGLEGSILCLQIEDHYLRVYTAAGSDLVLHRLSDAVNELAQSDGMQVHRSWWVARSALVSVETENRQKILVLSNDVRVPVSRSYLPAVREAGWLE
ncbi:MAG: hypothetical protein Alpg2KO_33230 [Alphaproteobacteria bacterium]